MLRIMLSYLTLRKVPNNDLSPNLPNGIRTMAGETFQQRYCVYDGYSSHANADDEGPIFFYTGNESPVDQYVNQTGLMWELAPKHGALIVFAEHRYQGESVPDLTIWNDDCVRPSAL